MSSVGVTDQSEASGATALSNPTKIPQKVSRFATSYYPAQVSVCILRIQNFSGVCVGKIGWNMILTTHLYFDFI